jgi:DNA-binding response OmpR family regulator
MTSDRQSLRKVDRSSSQIRLAAPARAGTRRGAGRREGHADEDRTKTIAIVDDEFGLADVLHATLSDAGYRVFVAANGVRALEVMNEAPPDLVLLDFMMPLLDGPGVLRAMRADGRLAAVPVVLMSAMSESVVQTRCHGYAAFLRKPFGFDELLGVVNRFCLC